MEGKILEACVETFSQCVNAELQGANRLELCDRLDLGGTTPDETLIRQVFETVKIPIRVMIRPRGGDFCYSNDEILEMEQAISLCKQIGVEGIVLGMLDQNNHLDIEKMRPLVQLAKPLKVVVHKAIDLTVDLLWEMEQLRAMGGVDAILTSGACETAFEGRDTLNAMVAAQGNMRIVVAGKVTSDNIGHLNELIGASEYHGKKIVGDLA
jgi:copper homeostasis protein